MGGFNMRIVIIGGVAGGMSAATRLRRLNEDAEIIILEKGPYVSFANCGLPYYTGGEIKNREALLVQTPQSLHARFKLDVRPYSEAIAINAEAKTVTVRSGADTYDLTYDKLVLSPGAKAIIPPAEGLEEAENLFTLRNIPDVDKITAYIDQHKPKRAVVIGAGFIGLEMAENLTKRGIRVILIEKAPQVLPPLDEEMAAFVELELIRQGVRVITGTAAVAFRDKGKTVVLDNGESFASELTLMSVGVAPDTGLAQAAGIAVGQRGGIIVNQHYETNLKDIYAVGDAIIVKQTVTGEDALIALASPANRHGRQAADVISGMDRINTGSLGTAIVRVFKLTAASTGLNERQLRQADKTYSCVHVAGNSHATYYPGAQWMLIKLLFHPETGEIYGAQAVGGEGVDKRIDVLATAIKAGLKANELPELELAYAPPFGSAKDPVNMVGYAALNVMEGITHTIQWYELREKMAEGYQLIDVRMAVERKSGFIQDSINIPLDDLRSRLNELDPDRPYIVSCQAGLRSYIAERILRQHGFTVLNLDGAYGLYSVVRPEDIDQ